MRTTISFNDKLYKALKVRSAESGESISSIVENAVKFQLLEDLEDIESIQERKNEPTLSFDRLIKEFREEGLL